MPHSVALAEEIIQVMVFKHGIWQNNIFCTLQINKISY